GVEGEDRIVADARDQPAEEVWIYSLPGIGAVGGRDDGGRFRTVVLVVADRTRIAAGHVRGLLQRRFVVARRYHHERDRGKLTERTGSTWGRPLPEEGDGGRRVLEPDGSGRNSCAPAPRITWWNAARRRDASVLARPQDRAGARAPRRKRPHRSALRRRLSHSIGSRPGTTPCRA